MFDIGFSEIALIAVVALVVIGPERLPRVARVAGRMLGQLQRYVHSVKSEIDREIQLEELKKLQGELNSAAQGLESSLREGMKSVEDQAREMEGTFTMTDAELNARAETPAPEPESAPASETVVPALSARQPRALVDDPR